MWSFAICCVYLLLTLTLYFETLVNDLGCFPLDSCSFKNIVGLIICYKSLFWVWRRASNPSRWPPQTRSKCFTIDYNDIMGILKYVSQNISYLSLIGLSPLTSPHPKFLQQLLVQPSTPPVTTRFSLDNVISLSFGSYNSNLCEIVFPHYFTLTYNCDKLATYIYSLAHYTKGTFL